IGIVTAESRKQKVGKQVAESRTDCRRFNLNPIALGVKSSNFQIFKSDVAIGVKSDITTLTINNFRSTTFPQSELSLQFPVSSSSHKWCTPLRMSQECRLLSQSNQSLPKMASGHSTKQLARQPQRGLVACRFQVSSLGLVQRLRGCREFRVQSNQPLRIL